VTVRQRIDQLAAEPPVRDLGYAADQRMVAGALLGLQLLADEIDALKAERAGTPEPRALAAPAEVHVTEDRGDSEDHTDPGNRAGITDIVAQLAELTDEVDELTEQVRKLTKAVKQNTGKQKKKTKQ
jgi:hypothetical protein